MIFVVVWESFRCLLANSRQAVMCLVRRGFRLATVPYRPDWWSATQVVFPLEGSSRSIEQCWSSVRVIVVFSVTSLTKALLLPIAQSGRAASSGKSLGGSKLIYILRWLRSLGSLGSSMLQQFFRSLPQICASMQSCLRGLQTIPWTSCLCLCSDMQCNYGTFDGKVCAFPNLDQSTGFTTGGLQSGCRNFWRMISGMKLSSPFRVLANAVNTYVNILFLFFIFNKFANFKKTYFT